MKYWEIVADSLHKAGWEFGLDFDRLKREKTLIEPAKEWHFYPI